MLLKNLHGQVTRHFGSKKPLYHSKMKARQKQRLKAKTTSRQIARKLGGLRTNMNNYLKNINN